jgi:hypothetical protein
MPYKKTRYLATGTVLAALLTKYLSKNNFCFSSRFSLQFQSKVGKLFLDKCKGLPVFIPNTIC